MMNYVWAGMIVASYLFAFFTGNVEAVTEGAMDGAQRAVEMVFGLCGMMCLWTGLLEVAKRSGLTDVLAQLMRPLLSLLFPELKKEPEAKSAIVMNMTANFLGLSNAATPLGLAAMEELHRINGKSRRASDAMCMFVVINTASITLIPNTLLALRSAAGSADTFGILVPVWICSVASVIVGTTAVAVFSRKEARHR